MIRATLALLLALVSLPVAASAQTRFRFPAEDPEGYFFRRSPVIHVDHDPTVDPQKIKCLTFDGGGFPFCYDQHDGSDYLLSMGFATMDNYDVKVVAAALGEVTYAADGNYDRCHGTSGFVVTCDGHPIKANGVVVKHADGLSSRYWHLKKGSVKVKVGDKVSCGQLLGYVGSSGISSMPHLHFEVQDSAGKTVDPYAGKHSQPTSYWTQQVGAHGLPGGRCQGAAGDAGPPDSGDGGGDAALDPVWAGEGCSGAGSPPGATAWVGLALLLALRRRVRRRS